MVQISSCDYFVFSKKPPIFSQDAGGPFYFLEKKDMIFPCAVFPAAFFPLAEAAGVGAEDAAGFDLGAEAEGVSSSEKDSQPASWIVTIQHVSNHNSPCMDLGPK